MATAHFDDDFPFIQSDDPSNGTTQRAAPRSRVPAGSVGPAVALLGALWSLHVHGAGSSAAALALAVAVTTAVKAIVRLCRRQGLDTAAVGTHGDRRKGVC